MIARISLATLAATLLLVLGTADVAAQPTLVVGGPASSAADVSGETWLLTGSLGSSLATGTAYGESTAIRSGLIEPGAGPTGRPVNGDEFAPTGDLARSDWEAASGCSVISSEPVKHGLSVLLTAFILVMLIARPRTRPHPGQSAPRRVALPLLIATLLLPAAARADMPRTFDYQGVLMDLATEAPMNGVYLLRFSLYEGADEPFAVWAEQHNVTVIEGLVQVSLGQNESLPSGWNVAYWIEIEVSEAGEGDWEVLGPRLALNAVPYAMQAESASRAAWSDQSVTAQNALSIGGVSAAELIAQADPSVAISSHAANAGAHHSPQSIGIDLMPNSVTADNWIAAGSELIVGTDMWVGSDATVDGRPARRRRDGPGRRRGDRWGPRCGALSPGRAGRCRHRSPR